MDMLSSLTAEINNVANSLLYAEYLNYATNELGLFGQEAQDFAMNSVQDEIETEEANKKARARQERNRQALARTEAYIAYNKALELLEKIDINAPTLPTVKNLQNQLYELTKEMFDLNI